MSEEDYEKTVEEEAEELTNSTPEPIGEVEHASEAVFSAIGNASIEFKRLAQEARAQAQLPKEREFLNLAKSLDEALEICKTIMA